MLQPLWMWKSALTLMIFAFGASGPSALRKPPARSTQSSARTTSAALIASIASGTMAFEAGAPACRGWSVGKPQPILRSLTTASRSRRRQRLGQLRFLHLGIEIDVDRAARRGIGDPGGADERFARGGGGGGLVVPLGVVA